MRKLCARWGQRLLTIDQKRIRVTTSEQNLAYSNRNPNKFLHRFMTMDETWIHHYTPESREVGKCTKTSEKCNNRLRKLWLVFFGIHIFINYLVKRRSITGEYYDGLLNRAVDDH